MRAGHVHDTEPGGVVWSEWNDHEMVDAEVLRGRAVEGGECKWRAGSYERLPRMSRWLCYSSAPLVFQV